MKMYNIDLEIIDEVDSNSVDAYYNYAPINFEEYENVDTDYFSVHVTR